jgi:hypothetical protein
VKSLLIFCLCFPNQVVAEGLEGPSDTPTYGVFYIRSPSLGIQLEVYILGLNPQGDKLLKPSSIIYSTLQHTLLCSSWLTDLFLRLTKL